MAERIPIEPRGGPAEVAPHPPVASRSRLPDAAAWLRSSYRNNLHAFVRNLVPSGSHVLHLGSGDGSLLAALEPVAGLGVDISAETVAMARRLHPRLDFLQADVETEIERVAALETFDYVIVGDALGRMQDVWAFLRRLRPLLGESAHLILLYYNFLWEPLLKAAEGMRLKRSQGAQNWLPMRDLVNLVELAGFEAIATGYADPVPVGPQAFLQPINRVLSSLPVMRRAGITTYTVARPVTDARRNAEPTCSVVIPARNERGNIRAAIERTPALGSHLEMVFVEGHSGDGTAEEIRAVIAEHPERDIRLVDQGDAKGKGDAVRRGFAAATGEVLIILDADLTVPPEDLPKFWHALAEGKGDFINGTRMVYPMEKEAMRVANLAANRVFGAAFTWILRQRVTDTLCGTKALRASDYRRIAENRKVFGDFDPFGDFDLLFGASYLGLRIREVPIRYRSRTYGTTQISRWRHGVLLLGMTIRGARMLRFRRRAPSADTRPARRQPTPA